MRTKGQLSARDARLLNRATELAFTSKCNPRTRHGALIVRGGRIVGRGVNKDRNDPEFSKAPGSAFAVHAEIDALRNAGNTPVKGATIYVARVGSSGDLRMSRPCASCQAALKAAGVKTVVYTIDSMMSLDT